MTTIAYPLQRSPASGEEAAAKHIRGSTFLLLGRGIAVGLNLASQVILVRYLSKSDFGAFAYATSLVVVGQNIATLGLGSAVPRFVPIFDERGDHDRLFGSLVLAVGTIAALGLAMVLVVHGFRGVIARSFLDDRQALSLLLIMVVLAPVQALDTLLLGMFAVFSRPRAIFFRRHIVGPALKLTVVVLLVAGSRRVQFLAAGYVVAGVLGVGVYGVLFFRVLAKVGLLKKFSLRTMKVPAREILAFTIPMMSTDLLYVAIDSLNVFVLQHTRGAAELASFRSILPAARANELVMLTMVMLYLPLASRLYARDDRRGLNHLYWQSAIWTAVISFPIFSLTFALAGPVTTTLFGEAYSGSGVYLALVSFGYYLSSAIGLNGITLKVFKKVRYLVGIHVVTLVLNAAACLVLIPRYGALGAAIAVSGTLVVYNVLKQAGLRRGTGVSLFDRRYAGIYLRIGVLTAGLLVFQTIVSPPLIGGIVVAGAASLYLLWSARHLLEVEAMFPELLRIPFVRRLLQAGNPR